MNYLLPGHNLEIEEYREMFRTIPLLDFDKVDKLKKWKSKLRAYPSKVLKVAYESAVERERREK